MRSGVRKFNVGKFIFDQYHRIRLPNDRVTDMVNITQAKDAAIVLALAYLNQAVGHQDCKRQECA